jgi:hypothetical protein
MDSQERASSQDGDAIKRGRTWSRPSRCTWISGVLIHLLSVFLPKKLLLDH